MRKYLLLAAAALFMVFAAGCVDLFAVPGVAVSPDGGTIYFLGGDFSLMGGGGDNTTSVLSLSSANVSDGTSKVIVQGDDSSLVSAFAVNPANGEVAYVTTTKAGESGISIYGTDGGSRQLAGKDAFGGLISGTMMAFSKDGSKIALTGLLFPPEVTPAMLEDSSSDKMTPELMAKIKNVAWLINVADGSVKLISNPDTERTNTIAWSPNGNLIAFNAWVDSNDDGTVSSAGISGLPGMSAAAAPATSDLSEIHIYDVGSGSTVKVQATGLSFAPVFFSDSTVGYVAGDALSMMGGAGGSGGSGFGISTADVASGASTPFYSASNLITGISVSPDGSQVAWAEVESSAASGASSGGSMPPAKIFVSPVGTAGAKQIAELNGMFLVDVPVWTPDSKALFISSTNVLSSMMGGLGSMMGGMSTEATADAPKPQQVTWVDVGSGQTKVVFEGGMMNSGMFASLMSLAGIQGLDSMMGAGAGGS